MGISFFSLRNPDCMMAKGRGNPQTFQQSTSSGRDFKSEARGGAARSVMYCHGGKEVLSSAVIEGPYPSSGMWMLGRWFSSVFTSPSKKAMLKREDELTASIQMLEVKIKAQEESLQRSEGELQQARRDKQDTFQRSAKVEDQLKSIIGEKEKALKDYKLHASQWQSQCRKLEAKLALIEKETAQESLKSGAYPDDHANPGMLEVACKAVDKATEDLARALHGISVTSELPLGSVELEHFVCQISPARLAQFSRAIQVKYVWSHWICFQMFRGFEHVFFDVDGGQLTSPLDSKKHALDCFRSFQQNQSVSSSNSSHIFRAFCTWKYRQLFPQRLVQQAFFPFGIVVDEYGRFNGDAEIYDHFMAVARAVWSLHELAFSFDPPANILRMAPGQPFDKQFQEPVVPVENGDGKSQMVMLLVRPALRVRRSFVRSRVFLCENPNPEVLAHH